MDDKLLFQFFYLENSVFASFLNFKRTGIFIYHIVLRTQNADTKMNKYKKKQLALRGRRPG